MATNYKFTTPVTPAAFLKKPAPSTSSSASSAPKISSRPTFQERLRVKKMMAIRDSSTYQEGQVTDFVKKRLDKQIADIASHSYDTDHKRLSTALEQNRASSLASSSPSSPTHTNSESKKNSPAYPSSPSLLQEKVNGKF